MSHLLRLQLRRDRIQLPIWIVLTSLLWLVSGTSIANEFGHGEKARNLLTAVIANPGIVAVRGLPDGSSVAQLVWFQVFTFVAILAGLMGTFLVTRHVRAEEERGRQELVGAAPVRRGAPLRAALTLGAIADVVLGLASAGAMIAAGFDPVGAWLGGATVAAVALAFLGIGALLGQLLPTGRAANTGSIVVILLAYLLRSVGDALGEPDLPGLTIHPAWPTYLTPVGWAELVSPFREQRALPLVAILALVVVAGAAALAVQSRRDLGASLVPELPGRATARRGLGSAFGLAWRLHWPAIVGWALAGAVFGLFAGGLSGALRDAGEGNATIQQVLQGLAAGGQTASDLTDTFVVAIGIMAGVFASAAAIQAVLRMRGEESDGRAELLLAGPLTKPRWMLATLTVALIAALVVAAAFGLLAAGSFATALPAEDRLGSSLLAGVAQLPAALLFAGLTALAVAVLPRAATAIGWGALGLAYLLGPVGGILGLDDTVRDVSPFAHTPQVPGADPDWGGAIVVLAIGVALAALATLWMRRRELTT